MKETLLLLYLAADKTTRYLIVKDTDDAFNQVTRLAAEGCRDFGLFAGRPM